MANTKSAAKAARSSIKKKENNLFWKRRIKAILKSLNKTLETEGGNTDIIFEKQSAMQKVLDKAAKQNVLHKNKANRLKSRFAKKVAAHGATKSTSKSTKSSAKSTTTKGGDKADA
ncbi:MAG: 30S ribosomal protein S20 [Patescibacteria group bacterium]|uniref:Small ribosomal subunit protein bS20 n=1 Tax=candidate division WWE3 bacterium TaxID=2053526 RepID=A0A955EBC6_UNCKA|nr:30S ribosomal protein S20 [candidate division WWE3 bacterium]